MSGPIIQHLFPNGNFILNHLHHASDRLHSMSLLIDNVVKERNPNLRQDLLVRSARLNLEIREEMRALFETLLVLIYN